MSAIWMILGGFLIFLGLAGFLITVLFEQAAVRRLKRKYTDLYTKQME